VRARMESRPGFFDPRTGQIVINLAKCRDAADAAATGLRPGKARSLVAGGNFLWRNGVPEDRDRVKVNFL
ncbi:MAG: hypothetical protein LIP02_13405, partial [Bacteroidales bacterium]|nr:hypothetical protein [Bacteroidales bacterium]